MQVPSAATVARTRYFIGAAARAAGVVAVGAAAFMLVRDSWGIFWRAQQLIQEPPGYWTRETLQFLGPIAAVAGVGAALLRFGDRLAVFIAPDPAARCSRCGYALAGSSGGRCPECGLAWGVRGEDGIAGRADAAESSRG